MLTKALPLLTRAFVPTRQAMAGQQGCQPSLPRLASSPRLQYSPQCCSSEASEQSLMPLQCLLVGMQVPFGHWKPLHFFSEMQNWVDVCVGFSKAAFSERQRAMAQPQPPSPCLCPLLEGWESCPCRVISVSLYKSLPSCSRAPSAHYHSWWGPRQSRPGSRRHRRRPSAGGCSGRSGTGSWMPHRCDILLKPKPGGPPERGVPPSPPWAPGRRLPGVHALPESRHGLLVSMLCLLTRLLCLRDGFLRLASPARAPSKSGASFPLISVLGVCRQR